MRHSHFDVLFCVSEESGPVFMHKADIQEGVAVDGETQAPFKALIG